MYATMLYRPGTKMTIGGVGCDYIIIDRDTPGALDAALADGWSDTPPCAILDAALADAGGPPTRKEMEQKARSMGISFNWKTSDEALLAKIEAGL